MDSIFIYLLRDPRDERVRYVGKTNNPKKRKVTHFSQSMLAHGAAKTRWVLELRSLGLRPIFEIIETCTKETWRERERYWIAHYGGIRELFNARLGGELVPPRTSESYRVMAEKRRGIPRPASVGQKVSAALRGHVVTEETRQKLREANKRQFSSPENRARHSEAVKNWSARLSPEKKERCKVGLKVGMPLAHKALRNKWATVSQEDRKDWIARSHKWLSDPANSEKQRQKALKRWSKP